MGPSQPTSGPGQPSTGQNGPPAGISHTSTGISHPSAGIGHPSAGIGHPSAGSVIPARGSIIPARGSVIPARGWTIPAPVFDRSTEKTPILPRRHGSRPAAGIGFYRAIIQKCYSIADSGASHASKGASGGICLRLSYCSAAVNKTRSGNLLTVPPAGDRALRAMWTAAGKLPPLFLTRIRISRTC